jgi:hypothetical protein
VPWWVLQTLNVADRSGLGTAARDDDLSTRVRQVQTGKAVEKTHSGKKRSRADAGEGKLAAARQVGRFGGATRGPWRMRADERSAEARDRAVRPGC